MTWTAVCASAELRTVPRRSLVDGVEVVVWRLPDGSVAALDDRCAHQWVRLSMGAVLPDGCLVCPSHGWTFLPDGTNALDAGGAGVRAHEAREVGGHVEVRLRS